MVHKRITFQNEVTGNKLRITKSADCEYVSPQAYAFSVHFDSAVYKLMDICLEQIKNGSIDSNIIEANETRMFENFKERAIEVSKASEQRIYSQELLESIFDIFKSNKRKKRERAF